MSGVRVFAPATVGNVACGFDVLGLALEAPGDVVEARPVARPGIVLRAIVGDGGRLPLDAGRNSAAIAAAAVLREAQFDGGLELVLEKGLPLAGGLGGSAASSVAGAVAADAAIAAGLSLPALLACAGEGEAMGAGAIHLDNVAPCLYGGICLVLPPDAGRSVRPEASVRPGSTRGAPLVLQLPVPLELSVAVVHPEVEVRTEDARRLLGDRISLAQGVSQWGNTAGFVEALHRGDFALLGRTVRDAVAEPVRAPLVPGFERVRDAALEAGAVACSLSGSGPSMFALAEGVEVARAVADRMQAAFSEAGVRSSCHAGPVGRSGARVMEER